MVLQEHEIVSIPPVDPGELSLMSMHSVLNVLNVINGELMLLGDELAGDLHLLSPALDLCERLRVDLVDPDACLRHVAALPGTIGTIERVIAGALAGRPEERDDAAVNLSLANINSVFRVFEVRAREILARAQAPNEWVAMPIEELKADFRTVLAAIEKNSRGRFRILYNIARQGPSDYYIDFEIESDNQTGTVSMPMVFKDVMRDLIANARKYTQVGGAINVGLLEKSTGLTLIVNDNGRGIPPDELETVLHYGKRGSNVDGVRTLGGGFGLTKAFFVAKQFGGRFWIGSELGVGTRIRIEIPRPVGSS